MKRKKTLDLAYALKTPADSRELYASWAPNYDDDFVIANDYKLPQRVVAAFMASSSKSNILDVGAGTGVVGNLLKSAGFSHIDGIDISPEMLSEARNKGCYRHLYQGDLTKPLTQISDFSYDGILSAGTFTNGHVGPTALDELLRIAKINACFTISVNSVHWRNNAFDEKFNQLGSKIKCLTVTEVRIYGDEANGPHKNDLCNIVQFRKN